MPNDARGVPVSTDSPKALVAYETALTQFQSYFGDAVATLDAALAEQPDFVLGHLFKAAVLTTTSERRFTEIARPALAAAEKLLHKANDRERALAAAIKLLVDGDWHSACTALETVLVQWPRDAMALQLAHLFDFFRGDALNLRNRVTRVLPHWSPSTPGYSYVVGLHAFGLEECNQYPEAEAAARLALSLQPRDPWAVHAATHVMEMQGRIDEGISWLETRERDWAGDNMLAPHNWWHLALFFLDRGAVARVLEIYDRNIFGTSVDMSMVLLDATALLWRLHVLGHDFDKRMEAQADYWQAKLDTERGFYAFNDMHAMMAFAATGREKAARQLLNDLETASAAAGMNAAMTRDVGLPVARALWAFGRKEYGDVIRHLGPVRDISHRFGGSHAQRDVLTLTLIEAAIASGQKAYALSLLAERTVARPASALGWRLHGRACA